MKKQPIERIEFLDCPLAKLNLSDDFRKTSEILGFTTIREMTDMGWGKLWQMEGFDVDWFNELVKFLENRKMIVLLDPRR